MSAMSTEPPTPDGPTNDAPPASRPAPLSYATLDADGLPAFVPEAEAAIDRGESIRRIARLFRKRRLAEKYIAKSFRRRFDLEATDGTCVCCGDATDDVVTVGWFFETRRNFQIAPDVSARPLVSTHHSMCESCIDVWIHRQRWGRRLVASATVGTVATFAFIVLGWIFRRVWNLLPGWTGVLIYGPMVVGAAASVVGAILLRRVVPRPLRSLMPRWMKCQGIESFDARGDLILAAQVVVNDDGEDDAESSGDGGRRR